MTTFWDTYATLCARVGKAPSVVARECGMMYTNPTNWKRGAIPRNSTLRRIANYFGTEADDLLTGAAAVKSEAKDTIAAGGARDAVCYTHGGWSVHAICADGEAWFAARDAAEALGFDRPLAATAQHVRAEDVRTAMIRRGDTLSAAPTAVISAAGIVDLVRASASPDAHEFRRWIMGEVLPTVLSRAAGITQESIERMLGDPDTLIRLATELREARKAADGLRDKAQYFDALCASHDAHSIRDTAKLYGIEERVLVDYLLRSKLCYRGDGGRIMPYAKYSGTYFDVRLVICETTADFHSIPQTLITTRGIAEIRKRLLEEGVIHDADK